MDELYAIHFSGDHLAHYGRKGMKWGQNIFKTEDSVPEQVIPELVIPEQFITEQFITEDFIPEQFITEKKEESVSNLLKKAKNVVSNALSGLKDNVQDITILDKVANEINDILSDIKDMDTMDNASTKIKDVISKLKEQVDDADAFEKISGQISGIVNDLGATLVRAGEATKKAATSAMDKAEDIASDLKKRITDSEALERAAGKINDIVTALKNQVEDLETLNKAMAKIDDAFSDLKDKLKHGDCIESATVQRNDIAPIRSNAYVIHFSGEVEDEYLVHVGVKRRSGRYPWGSGDRPYQGESQAFQDRASAGKISKYEKKRLKEENKAQVERVKAAAAYAKAERKAAERATKATQTADKQLDKDFDRQQKRVEAEEKLKDKQNKDEVKAINQLSGKMLTPAQQAQLALANMDSMSNQDLKNMLDRIDYQQKLSNIAAADKTRGQKIMSNLGNAILDVAVKQLIPGAGKVFVEYGQSKLREALDLPESSKKDDKQNKQSKQNK